MNKSLFQTEQDSQNGRGRKVTAKQFFKENHDRGYFTKAEFVNYAGQLIRNEVPDFIGLIELMKDGATMNWKFSVREDKANREYVWIDFQFARAIKGFKVMIGGDILRFIQEYAIGLIKIDFTAEDLSIEALNN